MWRSPITDFETGSKLTVYESQEALFYFNGACDWVYSGRAATFLRRSIFRFLKKLIQRITGNESIFHAQVYFVNKVVLDIKWGAGDIVYQDPAGPVFNIGCFGQMNLAAEEPRCIVERLVGSEVSLKRSEVGNEVPPAACIAGAGSSGKCHAGQPDQHYPALPVLEGLRSCWHRMSHSCLENMDFPCRISAFPV